MEHMMLDFPAAGVSGISVPADGAPRGTITFEKATGVDGSGNTSWSNSIQYLLSGTTPNRLIKRVNGVDEICANDIQSVTFTRENGNSRILKVVLTASSLTPTGHTVTTNLNFDVKIRN